MPTVFLDRDGVINRKIVDGYVTSWGEFEWLPGSREAIKLLSDKGWNIYIVTNQACVGKGIISGEILEEIHGNMKRVLMEYGADISQIYVCPHKVEENCDCRKPKAGMLLTAAKEYMLNLNQAYMVGDSESDMHAARAVGAYGIYVTGNQSDIDTIVFKEKVANRYVRNLIEAAHFMIEREKNSE